jgi:hypothetical protein
LVLFAGAAVLAYYQWFRPGSRIPDGQIVVYADALDRTMAHYSKEVTRQAAAYQLPAEYFLALIVLESSGRKIIPPRFEPHVYERLKQVQQGKRDSYEHVTPAHLADATDDALKNLASSWGPFQLMGYKCLLLDVKVKDIRGPEAVYWGIHWMNLTYGKELKAGKFKDAFHIHNTGRRYPLTGRPRTHDPAYVDRGLKYMKHFAKALNDTTRIR